MTTPPGATAGLSLVGRLAALGFDGSVEAAELVTRLGLDDEGGAVVVSALAASADPALALKALQRLVFRCEHPGDLLAALRWHTGLRGRLIPLLGASAALGEQLAQHPGDWKLLVDDLTDRSRPSAHGLRRTLLDSVGAEASAPKTWGSGGAAARDASEETLDRLRLAYRRQLLLLAARDLGGQLDVADAAAELADLSAAALEAALAVATAGLPSGAAPVRVAVIGMGKCGGQELNYRSDVDIVVVAEALPGGDETAALDTATRLATGLLRACSALTREGDLFPVDFGLRPEGRSGPLVRTLASHETYYRRWANNWELQALLKARPVAGDLALGADYVRRLAPLVWTTGARPDLVHEVQAMRRRVEATLPHAIADREIKLGPGGLRDIEFAIQLLQLVHGRSDPALRSGTTLLALEALADGGYVARDDAAALAGSYRFLRSVEHRLQLLRLRRTHLVPAAGDPDRLWLARACGYRVEALAGFDADLRRQAAVVRRLHEKLFYRPLLAAAARLPAAEARLSQEAAAQRLQALGFSDTRQALAHLGALTAGVSRRAAIQQTLLPVMLQWFAEEPDPDGGLLAFRRLSDSLGATPWYLRSLRDEGGIAERLARLLGRSRFVADLIARAPEAMLMLGDDDALRPRTREVLERELFAVVRRGTSWEAGMAAARAIRRVELLRIAAGDLLGLLDLAAVQAALSDLAAATVAAAYDTAVRMAASTYPRGVLPVRMAVIAMGRLGSGELGYGSDADVVFIHQAVGNATEAAAARAGREVAETTRRLLALPAPDPPLLLDPGLRPEGRQGSLTVSLAGFIRYHQTRGQAWERQALLRAAPLCGDEIVTWQFLAAIQRLRYPRRLDPADEAEVRRLRARVQTERIASGLAPSERWRDLKFGPGGQADIEWAVQLLQLRHAAVIPELRMASTRAALLVATQHGLLSAEDGRELREGYAAASRLRDATVLVTGLPGNVLPAEGRDAAGVRRVAGEQLVNSAPERSHTVWQVAERVLAAGPRPKLRG